MLRQLLDNEIEIFDCRGFHCSTTPVREDELLAYYNLSLRVKKQIMHKPQVVASR
jgi:hypothetical protein